MKNQKNNSLTAVVGNAFTKVGKFLDKYSNVLATCFLMAMFVGTFVFADDAANAGDGTADELWGTLQGEIVKWVKRLGGVTMMVGGIMFGLGWRNDDPTQKTNGISTIIAGAIVIAVTALAGQFFK